MNRKDFVKACALTTAGFALTGFKPGENFIPPAAVTKKIFLTGGGFDLKTLHYIIGLTGKLKPKICFLPTPVGDSEAHITRWKAAAKELSFEPYVQKVFISSSEQTISFEETLLSVDAILVTGGNTLNAMALWKAHGIDQILRKAWERGILLSGASAGAICWFEQGLSDSRPQQLSKVEGLGFLKGSTCPHYTNEVNRRSTYLKMIQSKELLAGYGCDESAGLYFENDALVRVVTGKISDRAYKISRKNGRIIESELHAELL